MEYNYKRKKMGAFSCMFVLVLTLVAKADAFFLPSIFPTEATIVDNILNNTAALPVIQNDLSSLTFENTIDTNTVQSVLPTDETDNQNLKQSTLTSLSLSSEEETSTQIVNFVKNIVDNVANTVNLSTLESIPSMPLEINNLNDRVTRMQHDELSFGLHILNGTTKPTNENGIVETPITTNYFESNIDKRNRSALLELLGINNGTGIKEQTGSSVKNEPDLHGDVNLNISDVIDNIPELHERNTTAEDLIIEEYPQTLHLITEKIPTATTKSEIASPNVVENQKSNLLETYKSSINLGENTKLSEELETATEIEKNSKKQGRYLNELQTTTTESILRLKFLIPPEQPNIIKKLNPFPDRQMRALGGRTVKQTVNVQKNEIKIENNFENSSTTEAVEVANTALNFTKIKEESDQSSSSSELESDSSSSSQEGERSGSIESLNSLSNSSNSSIKSSESNENSSNSSSESDSNSNSNQLELDIHLRTINSTTTSGYEMQENSSILTDTSTEITVNDVSSTETLSNLTKSDHSPAVNSISKAPITDSTTIFDNEMQEYTTMLTETSTKITITDVSSTETLSNLTSMLLNELNPSTGDGHHFVYKKPGVGNDINLEEPTGVTNDAESKDFIENTTDKIAVNYVEPVTSKVTQIGKDLIANEVEEKNTDKTTSSTLSMETTTSSIKNEDKQFFVTPVVTQITPEDYVTSVLPSSSIEPFPEMDITMNPIEWKDHDLKTEKVDTTEKITETLWSVLPTEEKVETTEKSTEALLSLLPTQKGLVEQDMPEETESLIKQEITSVGVSSTTTENVFKLEEGITVKSNIPFLNSNQRTSSANAIEVITPSPIVENSVSKGSRSIDESLTNRGNPMLADDNLKETSPDMGKALPTRSIEYKTASGQTTLIVILCITIAVLFLGLVTTIFFMSYQRHHGTLDIEMQEQHCGKDQDDEETMHNLLGPPQTDSGED